MTSNIPTKVRVAGKLVQVPVGTPPSRSSRDKNVGYYDENQGRFTIVLREQWETHGTLDPTVDLTHLLPKGFSRVQCAEYTCSTNHDMRAMHELNVVGFDPHALTAKPMGRGWYFAAREYPPDPDPTNDRTLVYLSRHDSGHLDDSHLSYYFPDMPDEIGENNESEFGSMWDGPSTHAWLLANGFTHSRDLQEALDDQPMEDW